MSRRSPFGMNSVTGPRLRLWLDSHEEELVAFRRHLHANPEPSGEEHQTTAFIAERLEVAGLKPRVLSSGTGLICDIGNGDGPLVALRGDIDALAMDDEKDVHYRSQVPGVAHACGHDVHTTVVLGAGIYLAHLAQELGGRVRLIFQPAEEQIPGGALDVIADDGLVGVDTVLGVHCDPKLDVGRIGLRAGPITSAADAAEIVLTGPGGHTARPEETVSMVELAARIVTELPDRVRAELGTSSGPIKLVFGSFRSGDAANVIPTHARLRASIRTPSDRAWERLGPAFERAVNAAVEGTGADHRVTYVRGVPPVVNHAETVEMLRRAARAELSDGRVTEAVQSWGGDDFAWYLRERPGAYIRLGTHDPDADGERLDLHRGHFDVDERVIPIGVRVLTAAAYTHLQEQA